MSAVSHKLSPMKYLRLLLFLVFSIVLFSQISYFAIKWINPSKVNSVITKPLKDRAAPIITVCQEGKF